MSEKWVTRITMATVFALFTFIGWCLFSVAYEAKVEVPKARATRQLQLDTFYSVHNCRPEGYIPTRYDPIRTYRCDNGLFIAEDMK